METKTLREVLTKCEVEVEVRWASKASPIRKAVRWQNVNNLKTVVSLPPSIR